MKIVFNKRIYSHSFLLSNGSGQIPLSHTKALPLSSTINEKALAEAFDKGILI